MIYEISATTDVDDDYEDYDDYKEPNYNLILRLNQSYLNFFSLIFLSYNIVFLKKKLIQ